MQKDEMTPAMSKDETIPAALKRIERKLDDFERKLTSRK
jgi:hypothetical protein